MMKITLKDGKSYHCEQIERYNIFFLRFFPYKEEQWNWYLDTKFVDVHIGQLLSIKSINNTATAE